MNELQMIIPTLFEYELSDPIDEMHVLEELQARKLMDFFRDQPLFKWGGSNNGCEARADAVCVLLDEWGIANYKGWVFGGQYLKNHIGGLKQNWNYHVAPLLLVKKNDTILYCIIDPSTSPALQTIEEWAAQITDYPHSYYCIKQPRYYIFHDKKINRDNWHPRNRQNTKWMIQGLAGVNGLSTFGKGELVFNKGRLKNTLAAFEKLKKERPF